MQEMSLQGFNDGKYVQERGVEGMEVGNMCKGGMHRV